MLVMDLQYSVMYTNQIRININYLQSPPRHSSVNLLQVVHVKILNECDGGGFSAKVSRASSVGVLLTYERDNTVNEQ